MFTLKPLSKDAVPGAIGKAERYRLLSEPWQAESICRDVLGVEPDHQTALVLLILALTDQFDRGISAKDAMDVVAGLKSEYDRAYYSGIVEERRAMALLRLDRIEGASLTVDDRAVTVATPAYFDES